MELTHADGAQPLMGGGIGSHTYEEHPGHIGVFEIGGEQVKNVDLMFGDLFRGSEQSRVGTRIESEMPDQPSMLMGYDFLQAHHVLISPSHHTMYFTYEHGPVFQVRSARPVSAPAAQPPAPAPR